MDHLNSKAWDILKDDEQAAVTLRIVNNMSTLQAGEIMEKAHYKYLEILERAKVYIKIFSEYLEVHNEIAPSYTSITPEFREFLNLTIVKRLSLKEASSQMSNPMWMYKRYRETSIIKNMVRLANSNKAYNRQLLELIKDFDRWNNQRILPYEVQDPSAFKRRNKNAHIKNIKHIVNINPYSIKLIVEKYKFTTKASNTRLGYFVIFSDEYEDKIIPVHLKKRYQGKVLAELGKLGFYVFKYKEDAQKYISLVEEYVATNKTCKYGQKFWPEYRLHIQKSLNYNLIRKAIPSRKHYEDALFDLDRRLAKKT